MSGHQIAPIAEAEKKVACGGKVSFHGIQRIRQFGDRETDIDMPATTRDEDRVRAGAVAASEQQPADPNDGTNIQPLPRPPGLGAFYNPPGGVACMRATMHRLALWNATNR